MTEYSPEDYFSVETSKFKEIINISSEYVRTVSLYFNHIQDYVNKEASFGEDAVKRFELNKSSIISLKLSLVTPRFPDYNSYTPNFAPFNTELQTLCSSYKELELSIQCSLKALTECFETRKTAYLSQLKRIRDAANLSTRRAIQNERAESTLALAKVRGAWQQQGGQVSRQLEERISQLVDLNASLERTSEDQRSRIEDLEREGRSREVTLKAAVAEALAVQEERHKEQLRGLRGEIEGERERWQQQQQAQISDLKETHRESLEQQREYEQQLRSVLETELSRLRTECEDARSSVQKQSIQSSQDRATWSSRLQQEKEKLEQEVLSVQSESVQAQAQLKQEIADLMRQMKSKEAVRSSEREDTFSKQKVEWQARRDLELEQIRLKLHEDYRKTQLEMERQHREEISKLKHLHEQEVRRLLRDNDRLQRLLSKGPASSSHSLLNLSSTSTSSTHSRAPLQLTPTKTRVNSAPTGFRLEPNKTHLFRSETHRPRATAQKTVSFAPSSSSPTRAPRPGSVTTHPPPEHTANKENQPHHRQKQSQHWSEDPPPPPPPLSDFFDPTEGGHGESLNPIGSPVTSPRRHPSTDSRTQPSAHAPPPHSSSGLRSDTSLEKTLQTGSAASSRWKGTDSNYHVINDNVIRNREYGSRSAGRVGSSLGWGALKASLLDQEEQNQHQTQSRPDSPPNPFPLDVAVHSPTSKTNNRTKTNDYSESLDVVGTGGNAGRVVEYMGNLQNYLQSSTAGEGDSSNESGALEDLLTAGTHDDDSLLLTLTSSTTHSRGLGATQAESDSESDSGDSVFADNIVMNLSASYSNSLSTS